MPAWTQAAATMSGVCFLPLQPPSSRFAHLFLVPFHLAGAGGDAGDDDWDDKPKKKDEKKKDGKSKDAEAEPEADADEPLEVRVSNEYFLGDGSTLPLALGSSFSLLLIFAL
jgi:hypothetical protein